MARTEEEVSRGCEEIGYRKGTKAHNECVESTMKYERLHEEDMERKQREECARNVKVKNEE